MVRGVKQKTGLNVDSSIQDAMKRAKAHKSQLEEAAGFPSPNQTDLLNRELENGSEPESVRKIFED